MNTQSQMMNSAETPLKRKRGRPRKDESLVQAEAIPPPPVVDNSKKNKQCAETTITTTAVVGDDMVGQGVSGVIEGWFDAGYLVNVKVGNDDTYLRGVVFLPGKVTPLTASNDVAPEAKMYTRTEMPIPVQSPAIPMPCGMQAMDAMVEVQVQGLDSQLDQPASPVLPIMPQIGDNQVPEQNDLLKEFEASLAKDPIEQSKPMPPPPSVPIIDASPEPAVNLELQIQHQATDNELKPSQPDHGVESQEAEHNNIRSPKTAKPVEMCPELMKKPASPTNPALPELPVETISGIDTSKQNGKPENHNAESEKSTAATLFEREVMAEEGSVVQMMNQPQLLCTDNMKIDSVAVNLFERCDPPPPTSLVSDKPELQPQSCSEGCDSTNRIIGDQMKIV